MPRSVLPVSTLTADRFWPYGQVLQAYAENAVPQDIRVTVGTNGTAKFHNLSLVESSYPPESGAKTAISLIRGQPGVLDESGLFPITRLERHACTNQAFVPMGLGGPESLKEPGKGYIIVVADGGPNDRPDPKTIKVFFAGGSQGVSYNTGVWHHSLAVLGKPMDFAVIDTQIGDGSKVDCEIVPIEGDIVADVSEYL